MAKVKIEPHLAPTPTLTLTMPHTPDAEANCSTNFGQSGCVSTSACIGGTDVDALCEPSLGETFCQACDRSNTSVEVYFVPATDERVAHCKPCGAAAMNNLLLLLGVIVGLAIALLGALALRRCISPQRLEKFDLVANQLALKNKLKIVIGFYMIATRVPSTYDVSLPAEVRRLLEQMTLIISLGMKGVETTPLECMGLAGYMPRLLAWMIAPLVVTAIILLGVGGRRSFRPKRKDEPASESSSGASEEVAAAEVEAMAAAEVAAEAVAAAEVAAAKAAAEEAAAVEAAAMGAVAMMEAGAEGEEVEKAVKAAKEAAKEATKKTEAGVAAAKAQKEAEAALAKAANKEEAAKVVKAAKDANEDASHGGLHFVADAASEDASDISLLESALPPFLQIMFLMYPLVTNVAFEGFPCAFTMLHAPCTCTHHIACHA